MSSRPEPAASAAVDAELLLRSLCHTVRGQLSRLHLRLELSSLGAAEVAAMTADLQAIDDQLSNHRDLQQSPPRRTPEAFPLWPLLSRLEAVQTAGMRLDLDPELHVRGWPEVLRMALRPLVHNALQYGRAPWTVWARRTEDGVQLGIRDAGEGFDPALLERLQTPFQHVLPHRHGGAGLGLPVAARALAWLGGNLRAVQCAEGFEIRVNLPDPSPG